MGNAGALGIEDFLDFFAGGAFKNFSIFMLTIMPYISMSIIMQLLTIVFPKLKKIQEEEGGKKKINRWTRYGTVVVALIQSYTVTQYAHSIPDAIVVGMAPSAFNLLAMLTITTGTMFLMWLGDQITRRGIGNGISHDHLRGHRGPHPRRPVDAGCSRSSSGTLNPVFVFIVLALLVVVIGPGRHGAAGAAEDPRALRQARHRAADVRRAEHLPAVQGQPLGGHPGHLRLVHSRCSPCRSRRTSGRGIEWLSRFASWLRPNGVPYDVAYALLIIFFAYFYTQVTLNPVEISKHIRENGGSIPGHPQREDGGVPLADPVPDHPPRVAVPRVHRDHPHPRAELVQVPAVGRVPDGRHVAADPRRAWTSTRCPRSRGTCGCTTTTAS